MTGTKGKGRTSAVILAVAVFLLVASVFMFSDGTYADSVYVELTDHEGQELDKPIFSTDVYFDTDTTAEGTYYRLSSGTVIPINDDEITMKVIATTGNYNVKVSLYPSDPTDPENNRYGFLLSTGIRILLTDSDNNVLHVDLIHTEDPETDFIADVKDAQENIASFTPGVGYTISIQTLDEYNSMTVPLGAKGLTVDFLPSMAGDTKLIRFISLNQTIEERPVHIDDTVGELPEVTYPGHELEGWFDRDNQRVTADTPVSALPSDYYDQDGAYVITAKWYVPPDPPGPDPPEPWPKVYVEEETIYNEDGSVTYIRVTTTYYKDGSINVDVYTITTYPDGSVEESDIKEDIDSKGETSGTSTSSSVEKHDDGSETHTQTKDTTYPDGSSESYKNVVDYDKDGNEISNVVDNTRTDSEGRTEGYYSETKITIHDDGSETWDVDTRKSELDGSKVVTETVTVYYPDGDMESEQKDVTYYDTEGDSKEYSVTVTNIGDEKEIRYRVDAILPDTTVLDVETAKDIIDEYVYEIAVVGTYSEEGMIIIPEQTLPLVAEYGYEISVSTEGQYVLLDSDVVDALAERGGEVILMVHKAKDDELTEEQRRVIGDNYAIELIMTIDGEYVTELHGSAEIIVEPGYASIAVWYVNDDGEKELIDSSYDPETGRVSFDVGHFSVYMMEMEHQPSEDTKDWTLEIVIGAVIVAIVVLLLFLVLRHRRDDNDQA